MIPEYVRAIQVVAIVLVIGVILLCALLGDDGMSGFFGHDELGGGDDEPLR